jgi:hypothetical protein
MIPQPIIRFEVEHLKHCILHAFSEYALSFDKDIKEAINRFCKPENIQRIMNEAVRETMEQAINDEVQSFFRFGKGREVIKKVITKNLEESYL